MRFSALETVRDRKPVKVELPNADVRAFFAQNVFNEDSMKAYLNKEAFLAIRSAVDQAKPISRGMASQVANGMKRWAMDQGATHFTHWFQPLTGSTAEKHDSFYTPDGNSVIAKLTAGELVQQEPDASSLPSGGLRNTFEARGYTAWDPSSPAFIYENTSGKTLCIPTVFVSYTGEALDYKTPLLKSLNLVDNAATAVCKYFYKDVKKITASLGVEQEYFLIDRALYNARPDLILSGRTLFGYAAAKDQQMDDHYFGSIHDRVFNFMYDVEIESLKLGIPLRTRHNEVAPGQFECAPMFEEVNLAVDHNLLLMDLMEEIAEKHDFKVLLHEKPFAGINGSGKHNNWSLITDTGINLFDPGNSPESSLPFLTFFINTIKAVHEHADLLRASIADAGNDHRLGANEAPPAIMSIFIGSTLSKLLDNIEQNKKHEKDVEKVINISKIPEILVDNTDRNRTSPFAFTGNKFEFRAVGSTKNCSSPMTVLNTAVADQLMQFTKDVDERISGKKMKKNDAILDVLRKYIKESKDILFEGNGYGQAWVEEAAKRGLSNIKDTPTCLKAFISDKSKELMSAHGILSSTELDARYDIRLENFHKTIQIEGRVIDELAYTHILPPVIEYQGLVADSINSLKMAGLPDSAIKSQMQVLEEISHHLNIFKELVDKMVDGRRAANKLQSTEELAQAYNKEVRSHFDDIRYHADKLEKLVDDNLWNLPKYREMLYLK
jgi:glutamine synthetase